MEMDGQQVFGVLNWMEMDGTMDALNTSTLEISPEILSLIAELDEFKGAWRAIGKISPERLSALRRVATIESVGSSTRIEGATLTNGEVQRLLSNIEVRAFDTRDKQEVAGYAEVLERVFSSFGAIDLTVNHVKQLHRDLLVYSDKDMRHRGEYKTLPNHLEAFGPKGRSLGVVFETASPFDTPRLMRELVGWTKNALESSRLHPLLVIAIFGVVFLEIHPFQDGNGRLSRVLTTLLLLRSGYAYVPYASLESVIEQGKEEYYLALRKTQGTIRSKKPDWQPWALFFLKALQWHKQLLEAKMEREKILLSDLPELSMRILELGKERGRVTVADVAEFTGVSRNTIKDHIKGLTRKGYLTRHGAGRGSWYSLV
jgi:Fic family protein